jgi:acetylornithine deacetylase/succinyl-diaminopimelate desuccinylase-like protein
MGELELHQRVADRIAAEEDDLVELALELGRIDSPRGEELAVATRVLEWLRDEGIEAWLQPITDRSANAIGRIRGTGGGHSLIFDAHLDIGAPVAPTAPERLHRIHGAWVEQGILYGLGVVNDKAQVASFMIATRALLREGIRLRGDITLAAVAFETGAPSVGERQGIDFPGEGFGTWWLVNRGITADFALVGETSGFGLVMAECGALWLEVSMSGRRTYTPRFRRGPELAENPSAGVRLGAAIGLLEAWALEYEQRATVETSAGRITPRAQIVSFEGAPAQASLLLDIRLAPGANPRSIERDIRDLLAHSGLEARVEPRQWSRGYVAQNAGRLVDAVTDAHRRRFGTEPPAPLTEEISMWRDLNMFNEVGIPAICYGAPRTTEPYSDPGNRAMRVDDLVSATTVYALAAMELCGTDSSLPRPNAAPTP